jgi:hypothetical protein
LDRFIKRILIMELTEETLITHLDVQAPAGLWRRLGYRIFPNPQDPTAPPLVQIPPGVEDLDLLVMAGAVEQTKVASFLESSAAGFRTLIWAIVELQRRREVGRQARAVEELIVAISDLRNEFINLGQTIRNK